jgi:hypothetical protein
MSSGTLYLNWDFNGIPWKPDEIRLRVPDIDESVKVHLENHVEEHNTISQLDIDYVKMYITTDGKLVLPPPCVMIADEGKGKIKVTFSFNETK